ncbi:MAG: hypothetical protein WA996_22645 [Candidatus Promineifilaceae bacterium]
MTERKLKKGVEETKITKQASEDQRQSGPHPADVLRQVKDGPPSALRPAQVLALQRTVGNEVVQQLITNQAKSGVVQLHIAPETEGVYAENFPALGQTLKEIVGNIRTAGDQRNKLASAAVTSADYACEGGGGSESTQSGEDIYEGGGGSESPQGGEDIYEGGG